MSQSSGWTQPITQPELLWSLGSICALHRVPFSAELVAREFPPPCTHATLISAGRALGLRVKLIRLKPARVQRMVFPLLVGLKPLALSTEASTLEITPSPNLGLVTAADEERVVLFTPSSTAPETLSVAAFAARCTGEAWLAAPEAEAAASNDTVGGTTQQFGFSWFVPELLKHKTVWRDVLLASLALQLLALATPLFTQAIIDKVVVHRTQSTLIAIGIAMLILTVFSSALSWVRQYLVLHTGNRVDAVLGAAIWAHLLRLPVRYFQNRPTGVVSARLQGVEHIREFVASAAVSLVLDLPFLALALAVMLWYSVLLTAVVVAMLVVIAVVSLWVAPMFQTRLNEQFLLGARNQAFVTEHIAGFETLKSLQMEPQLRQRYAGYLATYLQAGFQTRQLGNTYNVFASTVDQLQTLTVLLLGAYTVMNEASFTIGMLVAFQMFAGKLSQPVMRIVGLWTQFQQARLSVERLGDVMNAPCEPYSLMPTRSDQSSGLIEIQKLAFRYSDDRPLLYQDLDLTLQPGKAIALMGPSGSGKSTLAKLLLGFYQPTAGSIRIGGVDVRHLAANELRAHFGVVPQETVLFSGSIYANLTAANPGASFEQVVQACRMAGIHSVIEALPQGYQTEVGERGAGLSGGQKQRLAIARALLKGPKVLIFDEATSALDMATAQNFARTVNSLKGKVTLLFITHALPKGLEVDEVWHLDPSGLRALQPAQVASPDAGKVAPITS